MTYQVSRRRLGALLLAGTTLAGCSTLTPAAAVSDVQLIANGLATILPLIDPAVAPIIAIVQPLVADVAVIAKSWDASVPLATRLQADVAAVQHALAPIVTLPPSVTGVIQAVVSLLPVVLASAGLAGAAKPGAMSPEQARAVLAGASAKK